MKFIVNKTVFTGGLQKVQGVAGTSSTLPILSCLLLEAADGRIRISGTSLDISIRGLFDATVEDPGAVAVNARKLYEIVRELPEDSVRLESGEGNQVKVAAGKAVFRLSGLAKDEYPAFPEIDPAKAGMVRVEVPALIEMIKKVACAAGENDVRAVLNGVLVIMGQNGAGIKTRLVATDGNRLTMLDRVISGKREEGVGAIVPKKAMIELRKFIESGLTQTEVELGFTNNQMIVKKGDALFLSKLIDGSFPNYLNVIPTKNNKEAAVSRESFLGALRRVSILANSQTKRMGLEVGDNNLRFFTKSQDGGEAVETIEAKTSGGRVTIGFNARYLHEAVSNMDTAHVVLKLEDPLSPCLIQPEGDESQTCVVMPMRLD